MRKRKFIDVSSYKCAQITFPIFALTHTHTWTYIRVCLLHEISRVKHLNSCVLAQSAAWLSEDRTLCNKRQQKPTTPFVAHKYTHTKHRKRHLENGLNSCKYNKRVATATNTNKTRNRRWQKFLCCCRYRCCLLVYCLRSKVGKFLLTSI